MLRVQPDKESKASNNASKEKHQMEKAKQRKQSRARTAPNKAKQSKETQAQTNQKGNRTNEDHKNP